MSVIIPTHNSAGTIVRALESVHRQHFQPIEIIVVDDGSSDPTRTIVEQYRDRGVQLIVLDGRHGASRARNEGIAVARGEYIAFLDSDDEWLTGKLAKQVAMLRANERLTLVGCGARRIGSDGVDRGRVYEGHRPVIVGPHAWRALLAYAFLCTPTVMAPRTAILEVGGFDQELVIGEDQDLWIRLARRGEIGYVHEDLVRVHESPDGLSTRHRARASKYALLIARRHLALARASLSQAEARAILASRLGNAGRMAYCNRDYRRGVYWLTQAILMGDSPLQNAWHLVTAAPVCRRLKAWIRHDALSS